jgi:hypothetical protein
MMPSPLLLSGNAGKSMVMQSSTGHEEECGATGTYVEPRKGNGSKSDKVTTSYIPFISGTPDGLSSARVPSNTPSTLPCGSVDQLQASRFCKERQLCGQVGPRFTACEPSSLCPCDISGGISSKCNTL